MTALPRRLDVFLNEDEVGTIFDTQPLSFEYSESWLSDHRSIALGKIPKEPGPLQGQAVLAFFDNLLPEGDLRSYIEKKHQTTTLFGLLHAIGGDSAGAFMILPEGERPLAARYEETAWNVIAKKLASGGVLAADIKTKDARISLAGAQDKTAIAISADGRPLLPHNASPSTHILKPEIRRLEGVWNSALNEALIMTAAQRCELVTASVFFEPETRACIVERFDRIGRPPEPVRRLVQFDLCQLSETPSGVKYEQDGGPSFAKCAELIRTYSSRPAVDLRRMLQWLFFNLYTGNNDSHAKNLSIYWAEGGASLTPFYDLMCTRLYPGLARRFAFDIGGEVLPGKIGREQITRLAQGIGMRPSFLFETAESVSAYLPAAMDSAIESLSPTFAHSDEVLAARLRAFVAKTTRQFLQRLIAKPVTDKSSAIKRRLRPS